MRAKLPHKLTAASTKQELLENLLALVDVLTFGVEGENLAAGALHTAAGQELGTNANALLEPVCVCVTTDRSVAADWTLEDHTVADEAASFVCAASHWQADTNALALFYDVYGLREGVWPAVRFERFPATAQVHQEKIHTDQSLTVDGIGLDGVYANEQDPTLWSIQFLQANAPAAAVTFCTVALVKRYLGRS